MHTTIPSHAKKVFDGTIFSVWQWEQALYDGSKTTFECAQRVDAAFVVPVLNDGSILLTHDEQPHRDVILTVPGGKLEDGEDALTAAARELLEETGHVAKELIPWFSFEFGAKVACTFSYFIGRGSRLVQDATPDAGERITLAPYSLEEFVTALRTTTLNSPALRAEVLELLVQDPTMQILKERIYGN